MPSSQFARLLFDRMGESFQRLAEISLETPAQNGLENWFPSLFGGTTIYITTCDECGESRRSEDFMDLLIPIVDSEEEPLVSRQPGKAKRGNKSTAKSDVDVQQCLNRYLCPEILKGDNQYECSTWVFHLQIQPNALITVWLTLNISHFIPFIFSCNKKTMPGGWLVLLTYLQCSIFN